jgi:DNA-binding LytR/AlgR family response regulator
LHRILVIEDEPLARQRLVRLLRSAKGEREVLEAANGTEALAMIAEVKPHIVFLDVQMPGLSGLDVLEKLPDRRFEVVFVTAFQEHALRAFDEGACDYVLKPFRPERLHAALDRASRRVDLSAELPTKPSPPSSPSQENASLDQLVIREAGSVRVIQLADVIGFMSQDHYTLIYTADGAEWLSEHSLASLEEQLDPSTFARVHRKCIVRFGAVKSIGVGANPRIELVTGLSVPLARSRRREIMDRLRSPS